LNPDASNNRVNAETEEEARITKSSSLFSQCLAMSISDACGWQFLDCVLV